MLRVGILFLLTGTVLATDFCSSTNYKRYWEECSCSDFCLDNSHCQRDDHGRYLCQCLPCWSYDPVRGHCVSECVATTPTPTTEEPCVIDKLRADVYLLLDSSNSITAIGWARALNFTISVINTFNVSPNDVQFAFGIFSTPFKHIFDLNFSFDKAALEAKILATAQLKSNTNTGDALRSINTNDYLYGSSHGGSRNVRKIIVVVTDGQSQDTELTKAEAKKLRDKGVLAFAVGVGYLNDDELVGISGDSNRVFKVLSYGGLIDILKNLTDKFCPEQPTTPKLTTTTPKTTTTTTTTTTLPTTTTTIPTTPREPCGIGRPRADVYFLLDSSDHFAAAAWNRELVFVTNVINAFTVSPNDVQFAFGIFSTPLEHEFDLNYSYDKAVLAATILATAQLRSGTNTGDALRSINTNEYLYGSSHGGSRNVHKIIIVVTGGQSDDTEQTKAEAKKLRDKGVLVFAVGVGYLNDELVGIAGDLNHAFTVTSIDGLIGVLKNLPDKFCAGPPTTPTLTTTTTETTTTTTTATPTTTLPTTTTPTTTTPTTTTPTTTTTTTTTTTPTHDLCQELKPCHHTCQNTDDGGYVCSCKNGYTTNPSNSNECIDINECASSPCQHTCVNTEGSFKCTCDVGFAVDPADPTKCIKPVCVDKLIADIYFLGDSSNSIATPGWKKELTFINNVIEAFPISPNDVQVAFGIFSSQFVHIFDLNKYTDKTELQKNVLATAQLKTNTYTYDAINAINTKGYLTSAAYGGARDVKKILIVITDGQSQSIARTIAAADALRSKNVTILAVGVGAINPFELNGIAESPSNVFSVSAFNAIESIRGEICQRLCQVPEPSPVKACPNSGKMDLVIVIDSLNKFGSPNANLNNIFITTIINAFTVGRNNVYVAIMISDFTPYVFIDLTFSLETLYETLANDPKKNVTGHTLLGFTEASMFISSARSGRTESKKTIVLISDGKSHDSASILEQAKKVKDSGINVVTVAILPEADTNELASISSKTSNSIVVESYDKLWPSANLVIQAICQGF